jgi:DNA-binding beta-propeller fold protein YncE
MKLACLVALAAAPAFADSPAELEKLLATAAEPGVVMYEIARQYAIAGDRKQALAWMEKAAALNPEYDPRSDRGFETMAALPEFQSLVERARKASPPVRRSEIAFTVAENDLIPEGLAFDPRSGKLYLSSVNKHKIVEVVPGGKFRDFVSEGREGLGYVFGMKVDPRTNTLWANSLSDQEGSGVFHFDLATGRLIRKYVLPEDLDFNDLVVNSKGDVFITATRAQALYWISAKSGKLEQWRPGLRLRGANGIALSEDENRLFVATFPDGVTTIDLESGTVRPLARPANVSLAAIDGLYFHHNSLIAIQNGCVADRVARLYLNAALDRVEKAEVLERGNPLFDVPTTGALAGGAFYYIANSQLHNYGAKGIVDRAKLHPVSILKLKL